VTAGGVNVSAGGLQVRVRACRVYGVGPVALLRFCETWFNMPLFINCVVKVSTGGATVSTALVTGSAVSAYAVAVSGYTGTVFEARATGSSGPGFYLFKVCSACALDRWRCGHDCLNRCFCASQAFAVGVEQFSVRGDGLVTVRSGLTVSAGGFKVCARGS
jgi:hypothetical protein